MNLFAEWYGKQPGRDQTSRLKLEVAAAIFSTVCTVALSIWTIIDGTIRLQKGEDKDMELGVPMLAFAAVGLVFNCVSLLLFHIQGIPTSCAGDQGQLNLCAAVLHLVGDTIRMIVIFGSGLYITISGSEDSGKIDAWCAIFVSAFTLGLVIPVVYGMVLTINSLCSGGKKKADEYSPPCIDKLSTDDL